jgi:hypothetical protein
MPKFVYRCEKGHEFDAIVSRYEGFDTLMCEEADDDPTAKILTNDGEQLVCGRDAHRIDEKSVPSRRNPEHGIQRNSLGQ